VEVLPDRFDKYGRPIDETRGGPEQEIVERLAHQFTDVLDGRASWKDLVKVFLDDGARGEGGASRRR